MMRTPYPVKKPPLTLAALLYPHGERRITSERRLITFDPECKQGEFFQHKAGPSFGAHHLPRMHSSHEMI